MKVWSGRWSWGLGLAALGLMLLLVALGAARGSTAQSPALELAVAPDPATLSAGGRLTYTLTLRNSALSAGQGVRISFRLPAGFTYIPGTTRFGDAVQSGLQEPIRADQTLQWSNLSVPAGRNASYYGMHTFIQDQCNGGAIQAQLDRVRELMGPGAFVKQLFYRIGPETAGPERCWVDFVNACYDRNLLPVVRLQGHYGGPNWIKPNPGAPGDYSAIAQAYARVVAGLPRRENRPLYVEIWNEPNLDLEWSGQANPVEYAEFLVDVAAALRALGDSRIVILNGALSPGGNYGGRYESLSFIDGMATVPGALQAFDVWAAHPYAGNHPPEYNLHDNTAPLYPELTIDSYLLELRRLAAHGRTGLKVLLTETGYALGQNDFCFQGYAPIDEANRADYIARALRDYWGRWPEVLGVCPYELVDPAGVWWVWDWLYPDGRRHQQHDAVAALDKTPSLAKGELMLRFQVRAANTPGMYTARADVSSNNLGGASLNTCGTVQVMALPPSATPTASATPAGTPTVTPSPSPTPVCVPALRNGSFELDGDWEIPTTAYTARYNTIIAHGGARSLQTGIVGEPSVLSYSSARQSFSLPANASGARIRFWYYPVSADPAHGRQYVMLLNSEKQYLETVLSMRSDAAQWMLYEYLVVGHAGETLWLQFGAYNDGAGGTSALFVDDVSVEVCSASPTPTATPTTYVMPGPSPTPRQIWLPQIYRQGPALSNADVPDTLAAQSNAVAPLAVDRQWLKRPDGLTTLAQPASLPGAERVQALTLDTPRRRLAVSVVASGAPELRMLEAVTGRTLWSRPLPAAATALTVDERSGTLYALLPAQGTLLGVAQDGTLQAQVEGLGRPTRLVLGGARLYVSDSVGQRVIMLDPRTYAIMTLRELPAAPFGLALDAARQRLYVGQMGSGQVLALDALTLEIEQQAVLGGLGYPRELTLDAANQRLYVAHALSPKYGALSVLDTRDLSLLATRWGNPEQPLWGAESVQLDPAKGRVLLSLADGLLALDPETLAIQRLIPLTRAPSEGLTLARDPVEGAIYLAGAEGALWSWQPLD